MDGSAGNGIWQPGRVVAGRYRLDSLIGAGAMGVVWRAADLHLDRVVAVKQLKIPAGPTPEELPRARHQLFREARIAARLQHPLAVAVFDVTADDSRQPVLIMEYVPSQSLASVIADRGTLNAAEVARIGAVAAEALTAAHAAGILHRDIKPGNILLPYDSDRSDDGEAGRAGDGTPVLGTVKITDFGLAHIAGDVTVSGMVIGTPAYLAPETARGEPHTAASDVFSLGSTLYAAVEGTPPFGCVGDPDIQLDRVAYGRAEPPRRAGPLTRHLLAMLHDDPTARPTMSQVAQTLAAVAHDPDTDQATRSDGLQPTGTQVTVSASVPRAPRRRRALVALSAALGIGVLGLLVGTLMANDGTSSGTETRTETTQTNTETRTRTDTETRIRTDTETETRTETNIENGVRVGTRNGTGTGATENDTEDDDTGTDTGTDGAGDDTGNGTDHRSEKGASTPTNTETPAETTIETTVETTAETTTDNAAPPGPPPSTT